MGERIIDHIDGLEAGTAEPTVAAPPAPQGLPPPPTVDVNYPEPTALSQILRDVAKWSGQCFVMEPSANVKLQIFAPAKLTKPKAYQLFLASLSVVNLRAVQVGDAVKIVPAGLPVSA